jgi:branched-chain amino acid transport system substrate-binding protein
MTHRMQDLAVLVRTRSARALLATGVAAAAVGLAGCGSSSSGSSGGSSSTASGTTRSAAATTHVTYTAAAKYLGTTASGAASASKAPITLGWVNEQGGTISSPEATSGAEAAIDMIDKKLGGIDGHPLKLDVCLVQSTEEQGQTCAQKLDNASNVIGVLTGATGLSSQPLHSTLAAKKPIIGSIPSSPVDTGAKWSYYIGNGVFGAPASLATFAIKSLHAKKLAIVGPAFVGTTVAIHLIDALAKKDGVSVTTGTYAQGASDVTPAIIASKASSADAVVVLDNTSTGCIADAKAIQQLAVKASIVSLNTCDESSVGTALGSIPKWYFLAPLRVPVAGVADPTGEVGDYLSAMAAYEPSSTVQASAGPAFATVMYAAKLLDGLKGKATSAALNQAAAASHGPVFMGARTLTFGHPPFPAIGSLTNLVYKYNGGSSWAIGNGGKFQ